MGAPSRKDRVPPHQLGLKKHVEHKMAKDGNETRVQMNQEFEEILELLDAIIKKQSELSIQGNEPLTTHLNLDICFWEMKQGIYN